MGLFDFLYPSAESVLPVALIIKAVLTIAFVVLAVVIIRFLPKGKIAGLVLCFVAIGVLWIYT